MSQSDYGCMTYKLAMRSMYAATAVSRLLGTYFALSRHHWPMNVDKDLQGLLRREK